MSATPKIAPTRNASEHEEKKFSATIITNFLNNYYRNMASESSQSLMFKNYPADGLQRTNNKVVIDLYDYQGLIDFIETYKAMSDKEYKEIIERVFDMKLRACLDVADTYRLNDKSKLNVFQDFIIPQLEFSERKDTSIQSYINAINSFFENEAKIKTKIYNSVFPHDTHDPAKLPKGVNVIYLQHISKFHDKVLDMVINKGYDRERVLKEVQKLFCKHYSFADEKLTPEQRERYMTQMINPELIQMVLNPPRTNDKHGREIVDNKWIERLHVCTLNRKNGKMDETDELVKANDKRYIREIVRELMIVKSFYQIIKGGENARNIVRVVRDGKEVEEAVPMDVDFGECLDRYKKIYDSIMKFYHNWQNRIKKELADIERNKMKTGGRNAYYSVVDDEDENTTNDDVAANEEAERKTYALFLRYFVDSVLMVQKAFGYNNALKSFIGDIKREVNFKFNKDLRTKLTEMIKNNDVSDEAIDELAEKHYREWMFLNSPKTYDPNELGIYSKIGKFCGLPIKKDYRIAVGIAIVAYIQDQLKIVRAANAKKKEIQVYIKV